MHPPPPDIAKHMGGDNTGSAIDHRLRPIKQLAKLQVQCVERGSDPGDLPIEKGGKEFWACCAVAF